MAQVAAFSAFLPDSLGNVAMSTARMDQRTSSLRMLPPPCRDVFNEKPTLADVGPGEGGDEKEAALVLPHGAVIHTTKGDITLKLFPEECPKTIENFSTHAKNGYYDGIIIHRVIKGFMVQTGDPLGMPLSGI